MDIQHPIRLPRVLTDGVVTLDSHNLADVPHIVAGEDEEIGRRFDGGRPTTHSKAKHFIQHYAQRWAAGGPEITYALRLADKTLVGGVEIRRPRSRTAEVGYWVYAAFRGRGYARRGLVLVCATARDNIEALTEICANIEVDNIASRRTAEAAGFVEAGIVEDNGVTRMQLVRVL